MMGSPPLTSYDETQRLRAGPAVSWGAILAGAAVAIASSILLLALGAGMGFEALSAWTPRGDTAKFAITGAIWLIVTQWLSAALGGYITGRLRHRWLATHQHEVFFRDTAHGLVTWSVATLALVLWAGISFTSVAGDFARVGPGDAADQARKAAGEAAIYTALAMLIGAFIASVAAAIGGRLRDEHL